MADKTHDTIQKILRLAADPAATDGEAAAARKKAARLMEKHGLSASDLDREGTDKKVYHRRYFHESYKTCPSWYGEAAHTLAKLAGAFVVTKTKAVYEGPYGERERRLLLQYFGRKPRIEQAIYLLESLEGQINSLAKTWRKETGASRAETNGYRNGLVVTLRERVRRMMKPEGEERGGEAGLIRLGERLEQLHSRAEKVAARHIRFGGGGKTKANINGLENGKRDGDKLNVSKGVGSGKRRPRRRKLRR